MGIFKRLKQSLFDSFRSSKPKPKKKSSRKASPKKRKAAVKSSKPSKSKNKKAPRKAKARTKVKSVAGSKTKKPVKLGERIGEVTHYFPHVEAAVIKIEKLGLVIGDQIHIKGHTTDFKQTIASLQIDRKPIEKAVRGDEIGVQVKDRVRIGDQVYKITGKS